MNFENTKHTQAMFKITSDHPKLKTVFFCVTLKTRICDTKMSHKVKTATFGGFILYLI